MNSYLTEDFLACFRRLPEDVKEKVGHYLPTYNFRETEHVTHIASKNQIRVDTCYAILHGIEARGDYQGTWGLADDGYSDTVRLSRSR